MYGLHRRIEFAIRHRRKSHITTARMHLLKPLYSSHNHRAYAVQLALLSYRLPFPQHKAAVSRTPSQTKRKLAVGFSPPPGAQIAAWPRSPRRARSASHPHADHGVDGLPLALLHCSPSAFRPLVRQPLRSIPDKRAVAKLRARPGRQPGAREPVRGSERRRARRVGDTGAQRAAGIHHPGVHHQPHALHAARPSAAPGLRLRRSLRYPLLPPALRRAFRAPRARGSAGARLPVFDFHIPPGRAPRDARAEDDPRDSERRGARRQQVPRRAQQRPANPALTAFRHVPPLLPGWQTWLVYLSSPLALRQDGSSIVAGAPFTGTMRIALLPGNSPQREEALLDAHVATVPVGGRARVGAFRIKLSWRTQQWRKLAPGGTKTPLLMLSLPVHRRLRVFAHNPTPATSLRRHRSVSPSNDGTAAIRVSPDPAPAGLSSTRADGGWGESGWDSSSSSSGSSDGETGSLPTAQGNAASTATGDPAASNQAAMAWTSASSSSAARAAQETVLSYPTIDGRAIGVKGAVWELKVPKTPTTWHSPRLSSDSQLMDDLRASLKQDVAALPPLTTASTYFFGKAAARAARLALIAEQVHDDGSLAAVLPPLRAALTAWLDGTFPGNRLLYDPTWGGVVSEAGSRDKGADFGLGMYNDHHFHYGYFVYAAATVAKFDPMWGNRYRAQLAALVADYMSVNRTALFPRLRHFDAYALHSWASGLFDFADGRNQESFSEAANAYYAASLLAFTFGDLPLATLGATLAAVESVAAQVLMQVPVAGSSSSPTPSLSPAYEPVFADANRMLGMVWSTKRDAGLWFAAPAELDKRVGIQVLPVTPFLAHLFPDRAYARQLVEWAQPVLSGSGVTDEWRGFAWALQALYDPAGARGRISALGAFDDGNSKTNMLCWLASHSP